MIPSNIGHYILLLALVAITPLLGRNVILEVKGSYLLLHDTTLKQMYHKGGALCGSELTVQLSNNHNWYAFMSVDYLQKAGQFLSPCPVTKLSLLPLCVGLKYFVPVFCGRADLYLGLGFQPVALQTKNCVPFVIPKQSRSGFGGIAKVGVYAYMPHNFVIDFFVDYSFVKVNCKTMLQPVSGFVLPPKTNISGAIFGVGLGYRF